MNMLKNHYSRNIALIGSGYWGKNLARNLNKLGALKIICDKNKHVLETYANEYPEVENCSSLSDVLKRDDIEGIVIATPAETHFNIAREAILAEKHVFVEKPLVLRHEEALELINLNLRKNKTLMVGHLLQYHPAFVRIKELVKNGELGRINYIYSHRLNLGKIRREENILWSFAPHDISMILALAGEEPESVQTTGCNYLHNKIADITTTHLEFPSGLCAHVFVSWLHPFKEQKMVIVGNKKMAVFDDTQSWNDKIVLYPHTIEWKNNMPVPSKADAEKIPLSQDEPLRLECEHFLNSMINGNKALTDGYEGLRVLKVLNASQKSLDKQGKKIWLSTSGRSIKESKNRQVMAPKSYHIGKLPNDNQKDDYYAHPTAIIDDGCHIGDKTKIWHYSHILNGSKIGKKCNLGQNVVIGPDVRIGAYCKIQNNVSVYKGVTLENGVFCGPSMVFTNVYNPRAKIYKMDQIRPTHVSKCATLGANCTIVCGITIGKFAFVGAGSVVTKNIPDHALVVGNPAKQIGWVCKCGERLNNDLQCEECSKSYKAAGRGLIELYTKAGSKISAKVFSG